MREEDNYTSNRHRPIALMNPQNEEEAVAAGCIQCLEKVDMVGDVNESPKTMQTEEGDEAAKAMKVLGDIARLDTMVTVVDASTFQSHFKDDRMISEAQNDVDPEDDRTIVNLLVDQIEFANVIILNKLDLVTKEQLKFVRAAIKSLNAEAKVIETTYSKIAPEEIINTNLFSFEKASLMPMWLKEMRGEHVPETEEYGISSFIFRARRPFHPERLGDFLQTDELPKTGLLRSKGFVWVASLNDECVEWSGTSQVIQLSVGGNWFVTLPEEEWPVEDVNEVKNDFFGDYGDRRQELVFIGFDTAHKQRSVIEGLLEPLLLTDEEFAAGPAAWAEYPSNLELEVYDEDEEGDEEDDGDESDSQ